MSKANKTVIKPHKFIHLKVQQNGFMVYGMGSGTKDCFYRGKPLTEYLVKLFKEFHRLKSRLNNIHLRLTSRNKNSTYIQELIRTAWWAYTITRELSVFQERCYDGPINPLRFIYLNRLEEIWTKCAAAAHIYGNPDEGAMALQILLTDFEANGGVDTNTGRQGKGFGYSLLLYFVAYFQPSRSPATYKRFGELIDAITSMVISKYPSIISDLAGHIDKLLEESDFGFASPVPSSPAKTKLIQRLGALRSRLIEAGTATGAQPKVA